MAPNIKVIINDFGPIKDTEIIFAPMMIFTGNSNMGKSYVNYLMYYLVSSFTEGRLSELIGNKIVSGQKEQNFSVSEDEIRLWLNGSVEEFMQDFLGDNTLTCSVNFIFSIKDDKYADKINIRYTEHSPEELNRQKNSTDNFIVEAPNLSISVNDKTVRVISYISKERAIANILENYLQHHIFGRSISKSVILPPARGSFVGENFSFKEKVASAAGMYRIFLRDYDQGLNPFLRNKDEQFFNARIQSLTGGELITDKGTQYLILPTGHRLPLSAAASSIKELSPLFFYLKNWNAVNLSICIEEPEAHLHPSMQTAIADFLAACLNKDMFIQLTTHSDYFLQRINQLLKLGHIRRFDKQRFEEIAREQHLNNRYYIDNENVKAYYFHLNEKNEVKIELLDITEQGMPLASFFQTVKNLAEQDDFLENELEKLNAGENDKN